MGKKKKKNKNKNLPTKNIFWVAMTQQPQMRRNIVEVKRTTAAELRLRSKLEATVSEANPKFFEDDIAVQGQQDESEFVIDLTDNTINSQMMGSDVHNDGSKLTANTGIQLKLNAKTNVKNKSNQAESKENEKKAGNVTTKEAVVHGSASDIQLVVKDSSTSAQLAISKADDSTSPITYNETHGAKPIQSRITRAPNEAIGVNEEKKNLQYLSQQTPEPTQPSSWRDRKGSVPTLLSYMNYPKGIPRSFLEKPSAQTPEPYSHFLNKNSNPYINVQPNIPHPNYQAANAPTEIEPCWTPNVSSSAPTYMNVDDVESKPGLQHPMYDQAYDEGDDYQVYSPSDVYADNLASNSQEDLCNDLESDPPEHSGEKRQSAFDRLGPVSQPKKPKLTINLMIDKEQAVREVVDGAPEEPKEEKHTPVHLRKEILSSTDETIVKFRDLWPHRRTVPTTKTVTARASKSVMILELEQMDEFYVKENVYFLVSVKGYPPTWTKENVLDAMLEAIKIKGFIPCFIEFTREECKFLVIKSRLALIAIHKSGFCIRQGDVEMVVTISLTTLGLKHIEFIPRLILRKRLFLAYDAAKQSLNLSKFTTEEDISHFMYYPLNQSINQIELVQLQTSVEWENLTELNLSHNRLTSINGLNLHLMTPKLKHLDLSHNYLDNVMKLLSIRALPLKSIKLEGNPLCINYIDPDQYVKVLKTMFSTLQEIDGVPIKLKGDLPSFKKNYCPEDAKTIVEKFLEVYFPLLDASDENRAGIKEMYDEKASLTITYRFKLRYGPIYRLFRSLFHRSRVMDEGDTDSVDGASQISDHINKWPPLKHDPSTFTIDVIKHDNFMTIFKVGGILRLTSESVADEKHLLAFARTFVLHSYDGYEYKIINELLYWDIPTAEYGNSAFKLATIQQKKLNLELESEPDEDLKESLVKILMQLTDLSKNASERCLELKSWNLKLALDYFIKLLKLGDLETLTKEEKM